MLKWLFVAALIATLTTSVGGSAGGTVIIETAVIYDTYYEPSLPSFYKAILESSLHIVLKVFFQDNMTNIVETVTAAKVSSLFILAKNINCTAMIELKQAVTVFFVGMVREHCETGDKFMMYMNPAHSDVMLAMYDAMEKYEWKTAAVFYQESDEMAFGYQDLDLARQRGINLKVWVIPEDQELMWSILKSVRLLGYRTYILICDHKIATSVLTKAVFLSMVSEVNHWFLPNLETHPLLLQDFLESSVRLTVIGARVVREVLETAYIAGVSEREARDDIITALTADALTRIGQSCEEAIRIGCFDVPLSDDSLCGIDQGAKSFTAGSYYSVGTCTERYISRLKLIGPTKLEYLEHHLGNEKGVMTMQGYWVDNSFTPGYIPFVQAAVVFPEEPLKVGLVYERPWVKWHVNEVTSETTYEGFLVDLVETLSRRLNFKYELVWNEKTGPNRLNDDQAEDEVNRMLDNKEVEFVLYTRSILGGYLGDEEWSIAFQQVSYFMVTLASGNEQPVNIWQFLAPFTFDSWFALCSSLVVVSLMLALVNHFNPFEWRKLALDDTNDDVEVENFDRLGFGNSIWMTYGGLVHQGVDIEPKSYAGRMITGTWWYFTMLVIAAYTANLTAFLTQEFSEEVADLDELLLQEHFDYGTTEDAHMLKYFLPYADSPPFSTIWKYLEEHPENIFNSTEAIFDRISEGSFYFLAPFRDVAKAEQLSCQYARAGAGFWEYQYAIPFQLNSRYTAVFSDAIASLRDDGTLQELEAKYFNFRTECTEATFDIESNRLGIGNLGGMFITLLIGSILALVLHFGEVAWSKRRRIQYFRNKKDKKENKDDPITEMRRRRDQEKRELDQQIEEWEGGYDYWVKRMERINKTLEHIDEETMQQKKHLGHPIANENTEPQEEFGWWKNAYNNISKSISEKAHNEADLQRENDDFNEDSSSGSDKKDPENSAEQNESFDEDANRTTPAPAEFQDASNEKSQPQKVAADSGSDVDDPENVYETPTFDKSEGPAPTTSPSPDPAAPRIGRMMSFTRRKEF